MTGLDIALAATHARAFATARPWTAAEFSALLAGPGVILSGDATAFVLGRVTLDEAEILTLATDPAAQRQGFARAALIRFEQVAGQAGARVAFLEVAEDNAAARALYAGAGYAQVARRPSYYANLGGNRVAALILRKPLMSQDTTNLR